MKAEYARYDNVITFKLPSLNGLGAILAVGGGLMRKNPATAVNNEEYETYVKHADVNEYDATPWDRTDTGDNDDRLY